MTRMTGPDCAVMCNFINTHTRTHFGRINARGIKCKDDRVGLRGYVQFNKYTHAHTHTHTHTHTRAFDQRFS